jgi:hypothetical protein
MRTLPLLALLALAPTLALAQPSQPDKGRPPLPPPPSPPPSGEPAPPSSSDSAPVETTEQANRNGIVGAVTSPMRDVNVIRTRIPMTLLIAAQDPYARPRPATCAGLLAQVRQLNEVLGADLDEPASPDQRDLAERSQGLAIDALGSTARGFIPLRFWVRRLTGAEQHDREVAAAITAGNVRRAYLKGLGESRGCLPPATPRHLAVQPPPPLPPRTGPRYPIRR